jgi:hypothetical protein
VTPEARKRSRVLIALAAADAREFALDLARLVSLTTAPELLGLFVENARLLEHASSRLAREIMLTGRERPLERAVLERQLRAESAQARTSFEAAAARLGLACTFQVARGDFGTELASRAAEAEALVVSLAREARRADFWLGATLRELLAAPLPMVLLAREGWLSGRSIAVLIEEPQRAQLALEATARFAKHSRSPISVLLTGAAASAYEQNPAKLISELESRGLRSSTILAVGKSEPGSIARAARACRARLIVLPAPGPDADVALVEELLRRLPSALLLVQR